MPRLTIIEPRLTVAQGHHPGYLEALVSAANARFDEVVALTSTRASQAVRDRLRELGVQVEPTFRMEDPPTVPLAATRWLEHGLAYGRVVRDVLTCSRTDDRVLTYSGEAEYLVGLDLALRGLDCRTPLTMQFFYWVLPQKSRVADLPLRALRAQTRRAALRLCDRQRLRVVGQTGALADYIGRELGRPVDAAPVIVDWPDVVPKPAADGFPSVGFMGAIRPDKGFQTFRDAIPAVREPHAVRGVISNHIEFSDERFEHELAELERKAPGKWRRGPTTRETYYRELGRLDIIALPYRRRDYRHRTSTILVEAIGLGVIPVVPDATWLGDLVASQRCGVVYSGSEPEDLAAAIDEALRRRREIAERIELLAPAWRGRHNAIEAMRVLLR